MRTRAFAPILICFVVVMNANAHEPEEVAPPAATAAVLLERAEPVYPDAARRAGLGGAVTLELTVAPDGSVSSTRVIQSAGNSLDEATIEAARKFRFRPATKNGKAIESIVLFDQHFNVRPHIVAETSAEPVVDPAVESQPPTVTTNNYQSVVQGRGPTTAASSSSIRNLDFDLRPKTSPNDILRVVPGLLAVQHQGGGKADQLFLRGFDADHGTDVGVFVDGVPINLPSHAHGQGFTDLHWIIPEAIERIDVVKGPYDVRYGDFSTAGAVNLVTRKNFEESQVGFTVGGFPTQGCNSSIYRCKLVAQERLIAIVSPRFAGNSKFHPWLAGELARDDGPFENGQRLLRYNLFGKISYDFSSRTGVGLFLSGYGSGWNGSGQIPSREVDAARLNRFGAIDPSEGGLTQRQMITAFFHHKDSKHEFDASLYFIRYHLALWNNFTFFLANPDLGDEIEQDDARVVTGANLSYHLHSSWRNISFRTTFGAQLRYDATHVDLWDSSSQNGDFRKRITRHVDPSAFAFGSNNDMNVVNLSAYAEEDVVWNRWVRTIVGLRGDYFGFQVDDLGETLGAGVPSTSGSKQKGLASPKATLVITPWRPLDIYLNFGMGFHSNDARVAVQEGRTTTASGSVVNVVPRFYGGELGSRLTLWNKVSVAAAFWASYLENETLFSGDGGIFEPSDPTRRLGFDFEARAQPLSWLYFDFDLAQALATAVTNAGNGGAVALAPKLYMTGGVTFKHKVGVRAGLRFRYLGPRPAFNEDSDEYRALNATDPRRVNADGYFIVDVYGAYRYRWFEASATVQNLLNTSWREAQFGNNSCTRDEVNSTANSNYGACGRTLMAEQRVGVPDVHFTPGVPFNLQLSVKAYF